jgi:hypothetical protein
MTPLANSFIRSGLKMIGGALVMKGWLDAGAIDSFVSLMEMALGGMSAAAGLAWSIWSQRPRSREAAAIAAKVQAGPGAA